MKKRTIVTIVILAIIVPGLSTGVYFTTKIFNQSDWTYNVGEAIYVPNNAEVPRYEFIPDGHISVLPDGYGQWMTF
ncbi:MAG: hypothetical protein FK734_10350, partial [Asgard group archaeon]|nr:hypothetical protein [Asgard group archaeon]